MIDMPTSEALEISQTQLEGDKAGFYAAEPRSDTLARKENEGQLAKELMGSWHGLILPNAEDVEVGAPQCQSCEVIPRPMTEAGMLVLRFPHTFSLGKVLNFLSSSPWKHTRRDGLVQIEVDKGQLPLLLSPLVALLSSPEQRDTHAIYHFAGQLPQIQDYFEVESLPDFVEQVRATWLIEILRAQSIYSVFQPIVRCDEEAIVSKAPPIFAYECLMRGQHNGSTIAPGAMIDMARAADLIFQLDLAARRAAILGAGHNKIAQKVFINFSPNSIYDPWHCLRSTVNTVDEVGLRRDQVVFEITEADRLPEIKHLKRLVQFYREEGFEVALDDVGSGYSSLNVLVALRPDYVKLDMELIRDVDSDTNKAIVAGKLLETVQELGLSTVAEGVERPEELNWICAHGADFAQGYLFAKPATPPPSLSTLNQE
ncbi:putative cyclic di-GMP phosphodiesterase PdeG [Abditibacteriota bacterium]|nr:putative cyclic di-GMP phosphodiesterase PdeG [Abditibacteriota bacterium]